MTLENIDKMGNDELIKFIKDRFYRNIELELMIEQIKSDIEYNKEVIDEAKEEIDERVLNGTLEIKDKSVNI